MRHYFHPPYCTYQEEYPSIFCHVRYLRRKLRVRRSPLLPASAEVASQATSRHFHARIDGVMRLEQHFSCLRVIQEDRLVRRDSYSVAVHGKRDDLSGVFFFAVMLQPAVRARSAAVAARSARPFIVVALHEWAQACGGVFSFQDSFPDTHYTMPPIDRCRSSLPPQETRGGEFHIIRSYGFGWLGLDRKNTRQVASDVTG